MLLCQLKHYMNALITLHLHRLMGALVLVAVMLLAAFDQGTVKAQLHWGDVLGEGLASLLALLWLLVLLSARPPGRVTSILYCGATLYWLSTSLDFIDEFLHYPAEQRLFQNIESFCDPRGNAAVNCWFV